MKQPSRVLGVSLLIISLPALLALPGCDRKSAPTTAEEKEVVDSAEAEASPTSAKKSEKSAREVYATWYEVPADSLAKRRAGIRELTAAHDKLPLGTLVRVTHLENGKTVTVRITDRGIHRRRVKLDVCKEAAEELEMVSKGVARVRMEIVPEEHGASPPEARTAAPQP